MLDRQLGQVGHGAGDFAQRGQAAQVALDHRAHDFGAQPAQGALGGFLGIGRGFVQRLQPRLHPRTRQRLPGRRRDHRGQFGAGLQHPPRVVRIRRRVQYVAAAVGRLQTLRQCLRRSDGKGAGGHGPGALAGGKRRRQISRCRCGARAMLVGGIASGGTRRVRGSHSSNLKCEKRCGRFRRQIGLVRAMLPRFTPRAVRAFLL
ncbi:hypothetical protein D3C81_1075060 [compost metagenome]